MASSRISLTLMLTALSSCECVAQRSPAPIAAWTLTEAHLTGSHVDPVAGTMSATIIGAPQFSSQTPKAMLFRGRESEGVRITTDQPPTAAEEILPAKQLSVEAWVNIDETTEWGGICGYIQDNGAFERGWLLGYRDSSFSFAVASQERQKLTYVTDTVPFETGYWYHVVGTYDGQGISLYVDGKLRATSTEQTGAIAYPPSAEYAIGAYVDDDECHPLTGQIEQISVFNLPLEAADVLARFQRRRDTFPGIEAAIPDVVDWPTYRRDNQRTGLTKQPLPLPLYRQWVHKSRQAPRPAWPPPAKDDFWNRKHNLKPRVTFDRAFHSVCVGDALYFGSSSEDKVCCLNADTGEQRWCFYTEGPVRLAPTVFRDRLLFGSDDGCVYCLSTQGGQLLWKYRFDDVPDRRIPGNERMISALPVRSSVLVEDGVAWCTAGLFPGQGVYQIALNPATGEKIASGPLTVSAQGYLERRSGRLYVPAARDPAGAFVAELSKQGKGVTSEVSSIADEFPYSFIGAHGLRIGGGDGVVAAFDQTDGTELWRAAVDGAAYGLSIAAGRLFVNTSTGHTYCFASNASTANRTIVSKAPTPRRGEISARIRQQVKQILTLNDCRQGYCLVLNSGDGHLAAELTWESELQVIGVESDPHQIRSSREQLDAAGLAGRVSIHELNPNEKMPYTDYVFNLIIDANALAGEASMVDPAEVDRMLCPGRGVAWLDTTDEESHVIRRPALAGIGEWSHMYADPANTACSGDQHVRGKMMMQWFGRPGPRQMLNRHHRTAAPLFRNGRLFIPGNDQLFAADAYNGTLLWHKPLPDSRRVAVFRDCSYLAASDEHLFAAAAAECLMLNADTGYTEHRFDVLADPKTEERDWGYVANVDNLLIGSGCRPGAARREHTRESIMEGAYFDAQDVVCSDRLFVFDHVTTALHWKYFATAGAILNSSITIGDNSIYFVESTNRTTLQAASGRNKPQALLATGADVVALNLQTGELRWRRPCSLTATQHNLYVAYADRQLVIVGSRNQGEDLKSARVVYDIAVLNAKTGDLNWTTEQRQDTKIGGDHGEQDLHPVIVGQRLYCEPAAYNLISGEKLKDWGWTHGKRHGCGNISASASTFFFRESNPTAFDLQSGLTSPVTTATRPGCLINIIPAGGLLLIPEASSGCTCNYGVQTSLAFLPVEE